MAELKQLSTEYPVVFSSEYCDCDPDIPVISKRWW